MTNILDKEFTIGTWITLGHPAIAEILSSVGFDWIAVDLDLSNGLCGMVQPSGEQCSVLRRSVLRR